MGEFLFAAAYPRLKEMEVPMLTCALILLIFSPIIFLATTLETHFSPDELAEMGVRLENSHF
jgi:hypothetical protein